MMAPGGLGKARMYLRRVSSQEVVVGQSVGCRKPVGEPWHNTMSEILFYLQTLYSGAAA